MKLESNLHTLVWGTESWEVSAHKSSPSVIADGPNKGKALSEVKPDFPLLIKVIDAKTRLSVQVHPNNANAALTGGEPKLHVYCLTRAGQGVGIDRRKEYQYQSLAYNFGNKVAEPFFVTAGAVPAGTPLVVNCHDGQEFDYVMEGTLRFIVNGTEMVLNPGDSIYFNSGCPHGIQAVGDKPAKFLAIVL